jgi:hypothetical protein
MSDTDKKTESEETDDKEVTEDNFSLSDLKGLIKETVSEVLNERGTGAPRPGSRNAKADSIAEEVEAALARVSKAKEEEEAKKKDADWKASVEEKLKERPPVQRRKVHGLMGWGE